MIIPEINTDFLKRQYDLIMQLAVRSLEQPLYFRVVSFNHPRLLNCKSLAYLNNGVLQKN